MENQSWNNTSFNRKQKPLDDLSAVLCDVPSPICVSAMDEGFTVLYQNEAMLAMIDTPLMQVSQWITPDDRCQVHEELKAWEQVEVIGGIQIHNIQKHYQLRGQLYPNNRVIWSIQDISSEYEYKQAYVRLYEEYEAMIELSGKDFTVYHIDRQMLVLPKTMAEEYGLPMICENAPYSVVEQLFHDEDSKKRYIDFYESMIQGKTSGTAVVKLYNVRGESEWFSLSYTMLHDDDPLMKRTIISHENVTATREKEILYQKWRCRFEKAKENAVAYYEYDLSDDSFENITGPAAARVLKTYTFTGASRYIGETFVYEDDQAAYLQMFSRENLLMQFYQGNMEFKLEHRRYRDDGTLYWAKTSVQLVQDPYSDHVKASILIKDIDVSKKEQLRLVQLSKMDPLTGLLNRHALITQFEALLKNSPNEQHVLLVMDLDCFKSINDTKGHCFGDQVLKDVAKRISATIRDGDLCGRLGGDEFIAVLKGISSPALMEERLTEICRGLVFEYPTLRATISIGVAMFPDHGMDFHTLYQRGDEALYEVKRRGRNGYCIYEP